MKRIICLMFAVLSLSGCAAPVEKEQPSTASGATHIVVTLPTIDSSVMTGLPEVQREVNAITVPEIGVEVEFMTTPAQSSGVDYPNMITAGKPLDLMVLNNENIETYINQNMLLPLNVLLNDFGQEILEIDASYISLTDGTTYNGTIYGLGIPSTDAGQCAGLWIAPEVLKKVRFHYEPEKIYTFDELDVLFARMKEAFPAAYPLGQITNNYSFSTYSFFLGIVADSLFSADPAVIMLDGGGTEIVNLYESRVYRNWLEYMRKWYLAGYIYPDSAITTASSIGLLHEGIVLTVPQAGSPYMLDAANVGHDIVALRLSPIRQGTQGNIGIFWTIPITAQAPDAAMRFLNLMYSDERIVNLLQCGIQGRDYTLNAPGGFAGLDNSRYYNPLGMFGDQRLKYEKDGENRKAIREAFAKKAIRVNDRYIGFSFDSSGLVQELLEIDKVKSQYLKLLEAGCVDFYTVYPEFIEKLYDAGMQKLIDEKQRQLDLWLAENQENE